MASFTLGSILTPLPVDAFLERVWGREFAYVAGQPDKFASLLPWEALNTLLREHRFDASRLRLVKDGVTMPSAAYLKNGGQIDATELTAGLRSGATLNINAVHELHEPIAQLTESLEQALKERVQVNLYASWRTTKGFDLHWDGHDVFVVQVAGRKQWGLYGTTLSNPIRTETSETKAERPTDAVWNGVLNSGDVLYMPRGCWHVATPLDEPSLHLSFGIRQQTGIDFIHWLGGHVLANEACRENIPRLSDPATRQAYAVRLRAAVSSALTDETLAAFLADTDARAESRPVLSLPWAATEEILPPGNDVMVQLVPLRTRLELGRPDKVSVIAKGRRWSFAPRVRVMLERLITREPCALQDLLNLMEEGEERDQARGVIAKMLREGLIALVGASAPYTPVGVSGTDGDDLGAREPDAYDASLAAAPAHAR